MRIKSILANEYAKYIVKKQQKWVTNSIKTQEQVFKNLILKAKNTKFGLDHNFKEITNYKPIKINKISLIIFF